MDIESEKYYNIWSWVTLIFAIPAAYFFFNAYDNEMILSLIKWGVGTILLLIAAFGFRILSGIEVLKEK